MKFRPFQLDAPDPRTWTCICEGLSVEQGKEIKEICDEITGIYRGGCDTCFTLVPRQARFGYERSDRPRHPGDTMLSARI
jgi:hypothetical protein